MKSRSDRKLPLFAAPQHTEPNFGLTNFPLQCDTTPFSRSPLAGASESRGSGDIGGQRAKPWQCALLPRVVSGRGGAGRFTFPQPTLDGVIQTPEGPKTFTTTMMMTQKVAACCAQPVSNTRECTQRFATLVFSSDLEPPNLLATRKKNYVRM